MKKQEGTLNKAELEKWKAEHGALYRTEYFGEGFVWRPLKRKEFVEVMNMTNEDNPEELFYERQEVIVRKTVLSPAPERVAELIEQRGGLASGLSDEIMEKSGFQNALSKEL